MDFDRAEFVTKLPKGEETLVETIDDLRTKVEQVSEICVQFQTPAEDTRQARLLSYRLALAEKQIDRRLAVARQRKAEVGFVKEVLVSHNRKFSLTYASDIPIK